MRGLGRRAGGAHLGRGGGRKPDEGSGWQVGRQKGTQVSMGSGRQGEARLGEARKQAGQGRAVQGRAWQVGRKGGGVMRVHKRQEEGVGETEGARRACRRRGGSVAGGRSRAFPKRGPGGMEEGVEFLSTDKEGALWGVDAQGEDKGARAHGHPFQLAGRARAPADMMMEGARRGEAARPPIDRRGAAGGPTAVLAAGRARDWGAYAKKQHGDGAGARGRR